MKAVHAMIRDLRAMAIAPRTSWMRQSREIEGAPRMLTADAGIQGVNFTTIARLAATTAAHAKTENEGPCRALLAALADALEVEVGAAPEERPYHLRGDQ